MKILLLLIGILSFNQNVYADSPITSSDLSAAYKEYKIV